MIEIIMFTPADFPKDMLRLGDPIELRRLEPGQIVCLQSDDPAAVIGAYIDLTVGQWLKYRALIVETGPGWLRARLAKKYPTPFDKR